MNKAKDLSTWILRSDMRVLIGWKAGWYRRKWRGSDSEISVAELNCWWRLSDFLWCTVVFAATISRLHQIVSDPNQQEFDAIIYIWHLEAWVDLPSDSDLYIADQPFAMAETQKYLSRLLEKSKKIDALKKIFAAKVVLFIDTHFKVDSLDPTVKSILVENTLDFDEVTGLLSAHLIPILEGSS